MKCCLSALARTQRYTLRMHTCHPRWPPSFLFQSSHYRWLERDETLFGRTPPGALLSGGNNADRTVEWTEMSCCSRASHFSLSRETKLRLSVHEQSQNFNVRKQNIKIKHNMKRALPCCEEYVQLHLWKTHCVWFVVNHIVALEGNTAPHRPLTRHLSCAWRIEICATYQ